MVKGTGQTLVEEYVTLLTNAKSAGHVKPLLRTSIPDADESAAYQALSLYVEKQKQESDISGFKGALTNVNAQKMFSTKTSAMGVLFSKGELFPDVTISLDQYNVPLIETEIGFLVAKRIAPQPRAMDSENVLSHIDCALPMIEIVDIGVDGKLIGATDLIAINNAAANYIPGSKRTEICEDALASLSEATVKLTLDKNHLGEGSANDTMGGQIKALTWLVNQVLARGYTIEAGNWLMTGSLGSPYQAKPGKYHADYGDLGEINFEFT